MDLKGTQTHDRGTEQGHLRCHALANPGDQVLIAIVWLATTRIAALDWAPAGHTQSPDETILRSPLRLGKFSGRALAEPELGLSHGRRGHHPLHSVLPLDGQHLMVLLPTVLS